MEHDDTPTLLSSGARPEVLLVGRYAYQGDLQRGATGRVMRVRDVETGETWVAKTVAPHHAARLAAELDALRGVYHPSVVRPRELLRIAAPLGPPFALASGSAVLIEALVEGEPLAAGPCATWEALARVGEQLAEALSELHRLNLMHGDVSPHNVVRASGRCVLVDLGHTGAPVQSGVGASGTLGFMAPEAFVGARTPATDLFALGATLLCVAPGAVALSPPEGLSDAHAHALGLQELAKVRLASAPPSLAELITALLSPSPLVRPTDALDVARRFAWSSERAWTATSTPSATDELAPLRTRARRSGLRLAGALRNARFVGHEELLQAALERLRARAGGALPATLVLVLGTPGSGRDRVALELAQRLQRLAFDVGLPVPGLAHEQTLPHPCRERVIVIGQHTEGDPLEAVTRGLRFLDASEVERLPAVLVWSMSAEASDTLGRETNLLDDPRLMVLRVGPVGPDAVRALLLDALHEEPNPREVAAAQSLTGGLVGALVEQLATRAIEGRFLRAQDLLTLPPVASGWSPPALATATLELLEQACVCRDGLPLSADAPEGLSQALTLGLLTVDQAGDVFARVDIRRACLASMTSARQASVARGLLQRATTPLARAHLATLAGDAQLAEAELLKAVRGDSERGSPLAPTRVHEVTQGVPAASPATRREVASWLGRAAAGALALDVLNGLDDLESLALCAELLRQQGHMEHAARVLMRAAAHEGAAGSEAYLSSAGRLAVDRPDVFLVDAQALLQGFAQAHPGTSQDSPSFLEIRALSAWLRGDLESAELDAERSTQLALQRGRPGQAARGASLSATIAQRRGDTASAYAHGRRALELAKDAGERLAGAVYGLNLGLACFELGKLGEALAYVQSGAEQLADLGRDGLLAQAALNLAHIYTAFGDDSAATALLPLAIRMGKRAPLPAIVANAALTCSGIELRRGKRQAAVGHVDAALTLTLSCPQEAQPLIVARAALALAEAAEPQRAHALLQDDRLADLDGAHHADANLTRHLALGTLALSAGSAARREAVERLAPAASNPHGWERQLLSSLLTSELLERLADAPGALAEARRARTLLDLALESLPNNLRPQLLAAVRFQQALRVPPLGTTRALDALASRDAFRELPLHMQRFVSAGDPARLLQWIADAAQALTRAERGFVVERLGDGRWVALASTDAQVGHALGFSRSVVGRALATGRSVSALDALDDDALTTSGSVLGIGTRSVLAAPLHCAGRHLALYVDDRTRPAAFDLESEEVFAACAQLAGLALTAAWDAASLRQERQKLAAAEATLRTDVDSQRDELTTLRRAVMGTERGGMVAGPGPMRRILELAERAAVSAVPVLILGESGTGKELVARFIHDQSARRGARFVSENCAAIPETLLESALFGHERGAFTGADRARQGLFHSAHGGTLLLDEIGEMSPGMQSKLLRVLQNGEVRTVGGTKVTRVDVRLLTATHRDLRAMVAAGQFREDLYYRITVVTLQLPPLRERPNDIPLLIRHFLRKHQQGTAPRITSDAMQRLTAAPWPGNIRQLENEVQRLLVMAGDPIDVEDLTQQVVEAPRETRVREELSGSLAMRDHVDDLERRLIRAALARTDDNQTRAALELGVSRYGLQKMMKRLGLRD